MSCRVTKQCVFSRWEGVMELTKGTMMNCHEISLFVYWQHLGRENGSHMKKGQKNPWISEQKMTERKKKYNPYGMLLK